jgi:D-tyrosyl-tRNA(Tyr) deacylase
MRAVIQRVKNAKIEVENQLKARINTGLIVYISIANDDSDSDAQYMAQKIAGLRIFEDQNAKMNLSASETNAHILAVSNFTIQADCRKGKRPSFTNAANPDHALKLYNTFCSILKNHNLNVKKGVFGAKMQISSTNDGPVNFIVDSKKTF